MLKAYVIPNRYVEVEKGDYFISAQNDLMEALGCPNEWFLTEGDLPISLGVNYYNLETTPLVVPYRLIKDLEEGDILEIPFTEPLEVRCLQVGSKYGRYGKFEEALAFAAGGSTHG